SLRSKINPGSTCRKVEQMVAKNKNLTASSARAPAFWVYITARKKLGENSKAFADELKKFVDAILHYQQKDIAARLNNDWADATKNPEGYLSAWDQSDKSYTDEEGRRAFEGYFGLKNSPLLHAGLLID